MQNPIRTITGLTHNQKIISNTPADIDINTFSGKTSFTDDYNFSGLLGKSVSNAVYGLSKMVGAEFMINPTIVTWLPIRELTHFTGFSGSTVISVHLAIEGDSTGQFILLLEKKSAFKFIDTMLGMPEETLWLDDLACSVLGEMGNISASYFLNTIADSADQKLMPSPPSVCFDTIGTVIHTALVNRVEKSDHTYVVKAEYSNEEHQLNGTLVILPSIQFMKSAFSGTAD